MRPSASERLRASLGQRGVAFVLALVVELGLALLLWFMAPPLFEKKPPPTTTVFGIDTAPGDTEQPQRTEQKKAESKSETRERVREVQPRPVEPPPEPEPPADPVPETFIRMTRRDYAAADIKGMKSGAPSAPADAAGEASGGGSRPGDTAIVGKAPNGEPLYAAEWYRRPPTEAELRPYISSRALNRSGWGYITCRVISNHQVEDCQELGEAPRGSGYAGSVRQAAFQFRVRAPRVGGKEMIGAWVGIRITYTVTDRSAGGAGNPGNE